MSKFNIPFIFIILFFLGLSNALPGPLMGSSLSIWLTESGFDKKSIGLFSLISIPFSFKLLWSPLIDHIRLPFFKEAPRKGWLFYSLTGMAFSIFLMSFIDPAKETALLIGVLLLLGLFKSSLYMVGLSYELESLNPNQYSFGSASLLTGYRFGLLCAGTGLLYLSFVLNWQTAFLMIALLLTLSAFLVLFQPEPLQSKTVLEEKSIGYSRHQSLLIGFWKETLVEPLKLFFSKSNWIWIIFLIMTFKVGDHLSKSMEGIFYLSLGFNKAELALATKLWGMISTILGAFLVGLLFQRQEAIQFLGLFGVIHAASLFCNYLFTFVGKSMNFLIFTVCLEHFTSGMAMTVFIYFLWSICDKRFAAVQYAILWSLFILKAELLAAVGGYFAEHLAWNHFFLTVTFCALTTSLFVCLVTYRTYATVKLSYPNY